MTAAAKEYLYIPESQADKISYCHLLLLLASLPFDRFYSHLILISLVVHTLIHLDWKGCKRALQWRVLVLQSVFFVTVISTVYAINKPAAFQEWGKHITILLVPLVLAVNKINLAKCRTSLLLGYALVCTGTVLYLFGNAIYTIQYYRLPLSELSSPAFVNHNFSQPIAMHATFLSMQLAVAFVFLIMLILSEKHVYSRCCLLLCCCVLLAGLLQLGSKSVFICLLGVANIVLPLFVLSGKRRLWFMLGAMLVSAVLFLGIFRIGTFRQRYVGELRADLSRPEKNELFEPRLARWDAAMHLISGSPVIGYGAGSELGLLHREYFARKYYNSFLNYLNAHNQYLSFLIKSGIVGLLVYQFTLVLGFRGAIARRDVLYLTFMLLLALVSFSENYLDVDKGIFFYAVFFSFFVFSGNEKVAIAL